MAAPERIWIENVPIGEHPYVALSHEAETDIEYLRADTVAGWVSLTERKPTPEKDQIYPILIEGECLASATWFVGEGFVSDGITHWLDNIPKLSKASV